MSDSNTISGTIKEALNSLDSKGRLPFKIAHKLRRAVKNAHDEIKRDIIDKPEKYMGSFDTLSTNAQQAITQVIAKEDRWSMAGHELGKWHIVITRLLKRLGNNLSNDKLKRLKKIINLFEVASRCGPAHVIVFFYQWQLKWRGKYFVRPTLHSILLITGIKPRNLALCYARNIPQPLAYRGFWHDSTQKSTFGVIIAMDFIPTTHGYWHIENNLNFAVSAESFAPNESDRFVTNLFNFAIGKEYRHIVLINKLYTHVERNIAGLYEKTARDRGIKLTIIEDAYLPKSCYMQSHCIPSLDYNNTLVVRIRNYNISLDSLLDNKKATQKVLEDYKRHSSDPYLLLPPTSQEPVIGKVDMEDPFPNLIYKFPDASSGKGVIFLKVKSLDHAKSILGEAIKLNSPQSLTDKLNFMVKEATGLYQSYIYSPLSSDRKLSKIRTHVLITPVGVHFLSAHRVVSKFSVPEHLPFGVVKDKRPYLVNLSTSSKYTVISNDEEPALIKASLAIAKGISWAVAYGYKIADV
jgi:hypothetical protein